MKNRTENYKDVKPISKWNPMIPEEGIVMNNKVYAWKEEVSILSTYCEKCKLYKNCIDRDWNCSSFCSALGKDNGQGYFVEFGK